MAPRTLSNRPILGYGRPSLKWGTIGRNNGMSPIRDVPFVKIGFTASGILPGMGRALRVLLIFFRVRYGGRGAADGLKNVSGIEALLDRAEWILL